MHPLTAESLAVSGFLGKKKRTKHRHIVSMFDPIMVGVAGFEMYVSYNRWSGERKAAEQARRKQEMEG